MYLQGGEKVQEFYKDIDMDSAYQEYASLIYRFLYSYTHDVEWSQELMQETFLRAIGSISRYNGSCKLSCFVPRASQKETCKNGGINRLFTRQFYIRRRSQCA